MWLALRYLLLIYTELSQSYQRLRDLSNISVAIKGYGAQGEQRNRTLEPTRHMGATTTLVEIRAKGPTANNRAESTTSRKSFGMCALTGPSRFSRYQITPSATSWQESLQIGPIVDSDLIWRDQNFWASNLQISKFYCYKNVNKTPNRDWSRDHEVWLSKGLMITFWNMRTILDNVSSIPRMLAFFNSSENSNQLDILKWNGIVGCWKILISPWQHSAFVFWKTKW